MKYASMRIAVEDDDCYQRAIHEDCYCKRDQRDIELMRELIREMTRRERIQAEERTGFRWYTRVAEGCYLYEIFSLAEACAWVK